MIGRYVGLRTWVENAMFDFELTKSYTILLNSNETIFDCDLKMIHFSIACLLQLDLFRFSYVFIKPRAAAVLAKTSLSQSSELDALFNFSFSRDIVLEK